MSRFLARRLAAAALLLLGITLVTFLLTNVVPADPAAANLGQRAIEDPEAVASFNRRYGLDKPLPVQYMTYLGNLAQGDLGSSQQSRRPVREDLAEFAPATLELAGTAITISMVIGVALGTLAAFRRDRPADWVLRVVSLGGVSIPVFWLSLTALYGLTFRWRVFPGSGRLAPGAIKPDRVTGMYTVDALLDGDLATFRDAFMRLLLPALVLAAYAIGLITRFTRSAVLEVLGNDYVRAAFAKGLPLHTIVIRHVLRAALVPIITVIGVTFAGLLAGTVLVEKIFNWPGIGSYAYLSAISVDLPAIMGVSLFVAAVYITLNLIVDVLYGVIDPRVRQT
jgi:peptide/nickel transport system permease protein